MNRRWRAVFLFIIAAGFVCGFAGLWLPGQSALLEAPRSGRFQLQRLHVFLFNLVAGGTILMWFTEGKRVVSWRAMVYLVLALLFSLVTFLNHYTLAIVLAVTLAVIVELVRINRFSFVPTEIFQSEVPVAHKFHHAAVLCLSLGLLICAGVMINRRFLHLCPSLDLLLDDFFLGFSFPLSLISFAVMFALSDEKNSGPLRWIGEASFWVVTVGVIVFFVCIIMESFIGELASSFVLLADVIVIFSLFQTNRRHLEQTEFLVSGMWFLVASGITGVAITLFRAGQFREASGLGLLLQEHAYLSLYGWNLSGLTVVVRHDQFPLRMHAVEIILLHWVAIAFLAPLGTVYPVFAALALPTFVIVLTLMLLGRGHAHVASRTRNRPIVASPVWRLAEDRRR